MNGLKGFEDALARGSWERALSVHFVCESGTVDGLVQLLRF